MRTIGKETGHEINLEIEDVLDKKTQKNTIDCKFKLDRFSNLLSLKKCLPTNELTCCFVIFKVSMTLHKENILVVHLYVRKYFNERN